MMNTRLVTLARRSPAGGSPCAGRREHIQAFAGFAAPPPRGLSLLSLASSPSSLASPSPGTCW